MTDSGAKLAIATIIKATNKAILFFISIPSFLIKLFYQSEVGFPC